MGSTYQNIHQELIDDCSRGDTQAQFKIYKLYYKAMYNSCLRILNNTQEAEDIMQEAFYQHLIKSTPIKVKLVLEPGSKELSLTKP